MTDEPTHDAASAEPLPPESRAARSLTEHAPAQESAGSVPPRPEPEPGPRLWPRVVGVLILLIGAGGAWIWQNPDFVRSIFPGSSSPDPEAAKVQALQERVARLEQRPPPDLTPLTQRLDVLEKRAPQSVVTQPAPAVDLRPIIARLNVLEARSRETAQTSREPGAPPPDAQALEARLDALEKIVSEHAPDAGKVDALAAQVEALAARDPAGPLRDRLDALDRQLRDLSANTAKLAEGSERAVRLARWQLDLEIGHPLGAIPDAPPALARFATAAPPTLASLRLSFPAAAEAALKVSQPDTAGKPFLDRVVARLQDFRLVTVREGDHVVIGNPAAATLAHARTLLEAGDLAGAARAAGSLSGPPAEKMGPWLADATALLAAREALESLAGKG